MHQNPGQRVAKIHPDKHFSSVEMINAVVYCRTATVRFTQIPHPKFDSKGFFGTDPGVISLGYSAASIVLSALDKLLHFLTPQYTFVPEKNHQWVIVRVHSAGSI